MIYHVTTRQGWENAKISGSYVHDSLSKEGFIHACSREQLAGVLQRYYKDVPELLLLCIEEDNLSSHLKYEHSPSVNDAFPHIFGPVNLAAITGVEEF